MMDRQDPPQPSLFYRFCLEQRVPAEHPLRIIAKRVDFEFVYEQVEDLYGIVGKPSVPPAVILKLLFLLAFENVPSERRLMAVLPLRLDWLWFLGFDLDSEIPDHSVLSKARKRWGVKAFRNFFERVIEQAVNAGLVDGRKIFCDGSLFDANASRKSVVAVGVVDLSEVTDELEQRLDGDSDEDEEGREELPPARTERRSTTDPDAVVVTKPGAGPARPRYKAHRAVDDANGVITATDVTPGHVDESHALEDLMNQHEHNTDSELDVVVGDTQYGTTEAYTMCLDRGVAPRMPELAERAEAKQNKEGRYSRAAFRYLEAENVYICPADQRLRPTQHRHERNAVRYTADRQACAKCDLRGLCTEAKARSITRHVRQAEIDLALADLKTPSGRADLRRRKHLMERSFAVAVRHGFKRCRWRGLPAAEIHELLIATVQNVAIILRKASTRTKAGALALLVSCARHLLALRPLRSPGVLASALW